MEKVKTSQWSWGEFCSNCVKESENESFLEGLVMQEHPNWKREGKSSVFPNKGDFGLSQSKKRK